MQNYKINNKYFVIAVIILRIEILGILWESVFTHSFLVLITFSRCLVTLFWDYEFAACYFPHCTSFNNNNYLRIKYFVGLLQISRVLSLIQFSLSGVGLPTGVTMREKKSGALSRMQKLKKRLSHSFGRLCK